MPVLVFKTSFGYFPIADNLNKRQDSLPIAVNWLSNGTISKVGCSQRLNDLDNVTNTEPLSEGWRG